MALHLILNGYWAPLDFELPPESPFSGVPWRRWIDTSFDAPNDIVSWETARSVTGSTYRAEARSLVALFARAPGRM